MCMYEAEKYRESEFSQQTSKNIQQNINFLPKYFGFIISQKTKTSFSVKTVAVLTKS